jgi:hypothetical protein
MDPSVSPEERSMRARIAVHTSWAKTADRSARTAPARKAAMDRFEHEVDPDGALPAAERARRAEHLRKAHFTRISLLGVQARRRKAAEKHRSKEAPDAA